MQPDAQALLNAVADQRNRAMNEAAQAQAALALAVAENERLTGEATEAKAKIETLVDELAGLKAPPEAQA